MEIVATIQGIYYVVTGIWPVVSMGTFEKITGKKTDVWLVKMVALLVIVIGVVILVGHTDATVKLLAILSAISFIVIDLIYSIRKVISKVYLLDAAAQSALIAGWLLL